MISCFIFAICSSGGWGGKGGGAAGRRRGHTIPSVHYIYSLVKEKVKREMEGNITRYHYRHLNCFNMIGQPKFKRYWISIGFFIG